MGRTTRTSSLGGRLQARVRIDGKDHYLDDYDNPKSREVYDALITAWLRKEDYSRVRLTKEELVMAYLDFARGYYVKEGKPTSEIHYLRGAMRPLVARFGQLWARDFSPFKTECRAGGYQQPCLRPKFRSYLDAFELIDPAQVSVNTRRATRFFPGAFP